MGTRVKTMLTDEKSAYLTITRPEFLTNGSDSDFRKFIYGLLISSLHMEKLRDQIGDLIGVNGIQYHILAVISENRTSDTISVGEVAKILQAGSTYITMETGKLAKLGLIKKETNHRDRRSILLSLSKKGQAVLDSVAGSRQEINDAIFDGFSKNDFETFQVLIKKMVSTTSQAISVAKKIKAERDIRFDAA